MFYLMTHSTHFIYVICHQTYAKGPLSKIGNLQLALKGLLFPIIAVWVLLYAPSQRQDSTYHELCYTSCGALAGMRNSSEDPQREMDATVIPMSI